MSNSGSQTYTTGMCPVVVRDRKMKGGMERERRRGGREGGREVEVMRERG